MTITASPRPLHSDLPKAALGVVGTLAAAVGLAAAALAFTAGAVNLGNDNYSTEFVDDRWWIASLLLVIPIFFIARVKGWLGGLTAVLVGAVQLVVAAITVHRYQVSGWSDGLEGFAYLEAFAFAFIFVIAALAGWHVGRHGGRARAARAGIAARAPRA